MNRDVTSVGGGGWGGGGDGARLRPSRYRPEPFWQHPPRALGKRVAWWVGDPPPPCFKPSMSGNEKRQAGERLDPWYPNIGT